jgi:hypothetical protein
MTFKKLCTELEAVIESAYQDGVTLDQAERLAARFLDAQLKTSRQLKVHSLDAKMRKSGVKAIKAAILLAEIQKHEKKPSDSILTATVDSSDIVTGEESRQYEAEEDADELRRLYDVFGNAHIYFRSVAKGVQG